MVVSQGPSSAPSWSNSVQSLTSNGTTTLQNTAAGGSVLKLTGNGATTPNKFLGVLNGGFTIYSSNASTQLFTLTDGGALNILSTFTPTSGIVGVTTNSSAAAGIVGEYVTATGSSTGLTTTTSTTLTSVSLTAGDWDVQAVISYVAAAGTTATALVTGTSTGTTSTFPTSHSLAGVSIGSGIGAVNIAGPVTRYSLSSTTTVNAIGLAIFSGGTLSATGFIRARRVR
jgi:hypothetical protein